MSAGPVPRQKNIAASLNAMSMSIGFVSVASVAIESVVFPSVCDASVSDVSVSDVCVSVVSHDHAFFSMLVSKFLFFVTLDPRDRAYCMRDHCGRVPCHQAL